MNIGLLDYITYIMWQAVESFTKTTSFFRIYFKPMPQYVIQLFLHSTHWRKRMTPKLHPSQTYIFILSLAQLLRGLASSEASKYGAATMLSIPSWFDTVYENISDFMLAAWI